MEIRSGSEIPQSPNRISQATSWLSSFITNENNSLVVVFILATTLRITSFVVSGDYPGDAASRALTALDWMKTPSLLPERIWLPLHFYLMGGALYLWKDPVNTPRMVSLIFGVLSFFPFYALVNVEFGKKVALISSLIFSIYPLHISFSAVSMAEVPFFFFLLCALYFFLLCWKGKRIQQNLILSAIFLNLACMIRLEGWFFIPILAFSLVFKHSFKAGLLYLVLALILPSVYMFGCKRNLGVWIPYLQLSNPEIPHPNWTIFTPFKWGWPISLGLTPIVALLCAVGFLKSIFRKSHLIYALFIAILYIPLARVTALLPRFALYLMILFLPFFPIGFETLRDAFPIRWKKTVSVLTILLITSFALPLIAYSIYYSKSYSPFTLTPQYVKGISRWLKKNVRNDEGIILDSDKDQWWGTNILLIAGFDDWNRGGKVLQTQDWFHTPTTEEILNFIETRKPSHLLYSPRGYLPKVFLSIKNGEVHHWETFSFERIPYDDEEHYRIFKIQ